MKTKKNSDCVNAGAILFCIARIKPTYRESTNRPNQNKPQKKHKTKLNRPIVHTIEEFFFSQ